MATVITAPPYSFVKLSDSESFVTCYPNPVNCLPANNVGTPHFQMFASTLSTAPACFTPVRHILAYPVRTESSCENTDDIPDITVTPLLGRIENLSGSNAVFVFDVQDETFESSPLVDGIIEVGECYKYKIIEYWTCGEDPEPVDGYTTVLGCTNCFKRIDQLQGCYLSQISYGNNEDAYGFIYEGLSPVFKNSILLPFYLKNPQLPSAETSYRKSDGSYIKLSERVEEEYVLETDRMKHELHRNLKLALGHDSVIISNFNIGQQAFPLPGALPVTDTVLTVVCKEPYEIEWPEEVPLGAKMLAKAKTKVKLSEAVVFTNSNCE